MSTNLWYNANLTISNFEELFVALGNIKNVSNLFKLNINVFFPSVTASKSASYS